MDQDNQTYPLYSYAASNWIYYAREQWDDPSLLASAKRLFDPCKSACFTHWAVFLVLQLRGWAEKLEIEDQMNLVAEIVNENTHPLHFAAILSLPEISSFLLTQIEPQTSDYLIEKVFECAVDCLWGAIRHTGKGYTRFHTRARFRRLIGTDTSETCFMIHTIRLFIQHFEQTPRHMLLVTGGTVLAQCDSDQFSEEMQHLINVGLNSWDNEEMQSMCLFCESLSRTIDESAIIHFELCRLVWEYGLKIAQNIGYMKTYEIDSSISQDRLSLEKLSISACHDVDDTQLREAVKDARISTSSITDCDTGNGLLHNLVLGDHEEMKGALGMSGWEYRIELMLDILLGDGCSLSSRNNNGHTPFSLALEQGETRLAEILLERKEFASSAWGSPVPILLLVAKSGSETVLDQLLDLGLPTSPLDYSSKSPLHCLQANTELGLAIRFEQVLPGSRELRSDGKMPWKHYLHNTNFDPPSSDVLSFLIQPLLLHFESLEISNIWESYTANLSQHALRKRYKAADLVVKSLVQDGVLKQYEKARLKSGLFSFAGLFSAFSKDFDEGDFPISDSTMCLLLEATEYWTSFQDTDCAVQVLKLSTNLDYDMTSFQLMRRGVKVHRRVEGISALEHIYTLPAVDDENVSRIEEFLKHADPGSINQTNPTSGLGLIHVSTDMDEQQFRRKILELTMEAGASPNLRTASDVGDTGLTYHLDQKNFELACVLLEQGADPLIPSLHGWTAVHMAAARGAMLFMSRLLSPREPTWTIDWEHGCRTVYQSETFNDTTPLHVAVTASADVLLLLLQNVPSINLEAATDNGFTALHWAAMGGSINCVEDLVSRGANVNARSADGQLALHIAVEKGNLGLVERLLELGSEITARSDGMTPLFLAYENNQQLIIDRLKAHAAQSSAVAPVWDNVPSSPLLSQKPFHGGFGLEAFPPAKPFWIDSLRLISISQKRELAVSPL
ncbi:unnamed protein product [Colletotrichum noveboracense]|uniref:Uncharacterized protein n=1 Tax=Colletotrichum noveboracense TaxID=2664923 RepID=A0A9W4RNC9_9PEZI|nr:unnamed protein product [Colletotrichum noveboracense]